MQSVNKPRVISARKNKVVNKQERNIELIESDWGNSTFMQKRTFSVFTHPYQNMWGLPPFEAVCRKVVQGLHD